MVSSRVYIGMMLSVVAACGTAHPPPPAAPTALEQAVVELRASVPWAFDNNEGTPYYFVNATLKKNVLGMTLLKEGFIEVDMAQTAQKDLPHVLAHELGHAMGLGHSPDPRSLMYAYTLDDIPEVSNFSAHLKGECFRQNVECLTIKAVASTE